jgi:hypothetical protein
VEKLISIPIASWKKDKLLVQHLMCKFIEKAGELKEMPRFFGALTPEMRSVFADVNQAIGKALDFISGSFLTKGLKEKSRNFRRVGEKTVRSSYDRLSDDPGFRTMEFEVLERKHKARIREVSRTGMTLLWKSLIKLEMGIGCWWIMVVNTG